jgi:hypothetical protein
MSTGKEGKWAGSEGKRSTGKKSERCRVGGELSD